MQRAEPLVEVGEVAHEPLPEHCGVPRATLDAAPPVGGQLVPGDQGALEHVLTFRRGVGRPVLRASHHPLDVTGQGTFRAHARVGVEFPDVPAQVVMIPGVVVVRSQPGVDQGRQVTLGNGVRLLVARHLLEARVARSICLVQARDVAVPLFEILPVGLQAVGRKPEAVAKVVLVSQGIVRGLEAHDGLDLVENDLVDVSPKLRIEAPVAPKPLGVPALVGRNRHPGRVNRGDHVRQGGILVVAERIGAVIHRIESGLPGLPHQHLPNSLVPDTAPDRGKKPVKMRLGHVHRPVRERNLLPVAE